uniref:5_nucleotid_C domain-containing protein n=1 Tax=Macrostomum lignano TaxID=282301 RepID=A0A1I8FCL9_9PLAT
MPNARQLHILHFNDVCTTSSQPAHIGAPPAFVTALRSFAELQPLVLFSGDPRRPSARRPTASTWSRCSKPATSTPRVSAITTSTFGVDNLVQCSQENRIPLAAVQHHRQETGRPLAEGLEIVCIDHRASGLRIGIVGLVELEWVDTLSTVDPEDIRFFDFCTRGEQLAAKLKSEQSCDLEAGRAAHHIDIILGGHDHNYGIEFVNNRAIVKSGTDFRQFQRVKIQTVDVDSSKYSEDPEVAKAVESHVENLEKSMQRVLGQVDCPLECRFRAHIRTKETNMGNFMCDIVLTALAGRTSCWSTPASFRADCVVAGLVTSGWGISAAACFPMLDRLA